MTDRNRTIADALWNAQRDRTPCPPPSSSLQLVDEDAYAVQRINLDRRLDAGARLVGWKVGLTSEAIQSWLGVDEPDFGGLLDDMAVNDGGSVETSRLLQPRAEAEVAFVLGRELEGPGCSVADVLAATDYLLPAIEIIASRVADWKITWADTVADNASSGMFVLGSRPVPVAAVDLRLAGMRLAKNGRTVSTGAGAACLGSPAVAVAWLANKLAEMGERLRPGAIVLSGALGPVTNVAPGDWLAAEISGLGSVGCRFR